MISGPVFLRACVIFGMSATGLLLNLIVGYALYKCSPRLTASNLIYTNIVIKDILFCIIVSLLQAHLIFTRTTYPYWICQASGFSVQCFQGVGIFFILLQMLNPFRIIIMEQAALTVQTLSWITTFIWLLGAFSSIWPIISGDEYALMPNEIWCYINYETPKWGTTLLICCTVVVLTVAPLQLGASYYWMWRKMKMKQQKREREKRIEWIIVRQGIAYSTTFFLVWSYPAIAVIWRYFTHYTDGPDYDFVAAAIGLVANLTNPILLFYTNDNVQKEVLNLFVCIRRSRFSDKISLSQSQLIGDKIQPPKDDIPKTANDTILAENMRDKVKVATLNQDRNIIDDSTGTSTSIPETVQAVINECNNLIHLFSHYYIKTL